MYIETKYGGWPAKIYVPDDAGDKKYPTFIFIPGIDETYISGRAISLLDKNGPGYYLKGTWKPNYVIVSLQTSPWPGAAALNAAVQEILVHPNVDSNKVYGTGLSHGAKTWLNYVLQLPKYSEYLAGLVIMSSPNVTDLYGRNKGYISKLPIVFFHGTSDLAANTSIVPIREMYNDMKSKGFPVKKTEAAYSHCCWNTRFAPTYKDPNFGTDVYTEMLKYSRRTPIEVTSTTTSTTTEVPNTTTTTTTLPETTTTTTTEAPSVETTTIKPKRAVVRVTFYDDLSTTVEKFDALNRMYVEAIEPEQINWPEPPKTLKKENVFSRFFNSFK